MKKAFSLMELMVVIIILGLLASFVLPNLSGKSDEAKEKLACIQAKSIAQSVKMFSIDNGRLPSTAEGLQALINPPAQNMINYPKNGYFEDKKLPLDPWGGAYVYIQSNDSFDIISFGADMLESTDDDIVLSKCK